MRKYINYILAAIETIWLVVKNGFDTEKALKESDELLIEWRRKKLRKEQPK